MSWVNRTISRDTRTSHAEVYAGSVKRGSARYFLSICTLAIGAVLCFVSMHYVGAFIPQSKAISLSVYSDDSTDNKQGISRRIARLVSMPKYKKVYLMAGQAIEAEYNVPSTSSVTLHVMQCKRKLILEVFNCDPIAEQKVTSTGQRYGKRQIRVNHNGFYYFSETVTPTGQQQTASAENYVLIWRRA